MNSLTSSRKREQSASCSSDTNCPGGTGGSDFGSGCVSPASRRGNGLHPSFVVDFGGRPAERRARTVRTVVRLGARV
jgi:hypothetical protein